MAGQWINDTGQKQKYIAVRILLVVLYLPAIIGFFWGVSEKYFHLWIAYILIVIPLVTIIYFFSLRCPVCKSFPIWNEYFSRKKGKLPPVGTWKVCLLCKERNNGEVKEETKETLAN